MASAADSDNRIPLNIEVTSDTVCPWCFVGKRRLEKALAHIDRSKVNIKVHWKPFYLDPAAPLPSINKVERYKQKFGARIEQMLPRMLEVGKADGISFSFGGKTGNTANSHRIIAWATKQGKEDEIIEQLFKFYFEQERDITDIDTLAEAAKLVGLDENAARAYLLTDEGRAQVAREVQEAYDNNVSGVPSFNINNRYRFSGAQDPDFFLTVFSKLNLPLVK